MKPFINISHSEFELHNCAHFSSMVAVEGLEDGKPGPLPAGFGPRQQMRRVMGIRKDVPGEYIFLEVQLTKVR